MITIDQFQSILGDSFFGGDAAVAGVVIFAVTLAIVFVMMKRNVFGSLLISIPVAFVYSMLGILSADLMVIMIVVAVLGLATAGKKTLGE